MICETTVDEGLGGTNKLLLHLDNISRQYLKNYLIFLHLLELNKNCFPNFWVIICKDISF